MVDDGLGREDRLSEGLFFERNIFFELIASSIMINFCEKNFIDYFFPFISCRFDLLSI